MGDGGIEEGVVWDGVCMWCVGEGRLGGTASLRWCALEGQHRCDGMHRRDGFLMLCVGEGRRWDGWCASARDG